jgi:hypothetical protein
MEPFNRNAVHGVAIATDGLGLGLSEGERPGDWGTRNEPVPMNATLSVLDRGARPHSCPKRVKHGVAGRGSAAEGGLGRPLVSGETDGTSSGLPEHHELRGFFRPDVPGNDAGSRAAPAGFDEGIAGNTGESGDGELQ